MVIEESLIQSASVLIEQVASSNSSSVFIYDLAEHVGFGDFTKDLIENPPKHIWTRGAPTTGVLRIATLFKPIVVVATGSGIAPCLSLLQVYHNHPIRIIWSARSPEMTYGCRIMNAVLQADPQAVIIDTQKTGHPNLVALTYALHRKIKAEAVVVIGNGSVTPQLVYEMETRGIAAFGPIFDS